MIENTNLYSEKWSAAERDLDSGKKFLELGKYGTCVRRYVCICSKLIQAHPDADILGVINIAL